MASRCAIHDVPLRRFVGGSKACYDCVKVAMRAYDMHATLLVAQVRSVLSLTEYQRLKTVIEAAKLVATECSEDMLIFVLLACTAEQNGKTITGMIENLRSSQSADLLLGWIEPTLKQ